MVHTLCASVLQRPRSLGAIQQGRARVAQAIEPHDSAMAPQARQARVHSRDATPWVLTNTLQWLWVLVRDTAALSLMPPHRSPEACTTLLDDGGGILVRDGSGVYGHWVQARHTCVAHLMRTARGVAARDHPALAACGAWAMAELQRRCPLATAPPTGGEWRAWYARFCTLIDQ